MKQANHVFEKVTKYGIRKLSVGVGPVAIGTFLLAGGFFVSKPVSADQVTKDATVHMAYVAENELTAEEQQQVVHAIPEDYQNEDTFYLVYKRKGATQTSLPQTGSSDWVASGLGLATATMAVLLFSKKHRKKIIGLVLIGAAGQSLLVPIEVLALQNKELQAYNQTLAVADEADLAKGVIAIDGYEYVGYLRYSAKPELEQPLENTLQGLESSIKEETTVNQGTADKDSEGISWKKGTQESGHEGEAVVQPANPEYTGPISANGTQESGHEGEALVQPVAPEYTGPISANGTQEVGHEGEAVVQPVNPEYTGSINSDTTSAKGTQEPGHEGEALVQPVAPEYTGPISANGTQEVGHEGEALVQPATPEYTGLISSDTTSANGTQEVGHEGEAVVQPVNPAYTGSINSDTTSAKGTQESGHEGEALVQPENPVHTPVVGSITETETQAIDYPIEVITDDNEYVDEEVVEQEGKKGSQEIQKIYQTIDGVKVGEPTIVSGKVIEVPQPRKIRRGSKSLDGTTTEESIVELPFKEIVQEDDTLEKGTLQVVQEGQKGQNKITKVYKTYKGNKTAEEPTVTETVLVPVQDRIVRKGTKVSEKPVLTLTQIDKDDLGRSAKLSYNLTNPGSATITTIKAVLKQDGQVVQTLDIPSTTLTADLTNLDYYKPYTLTTTMTFDRGNGEESQVLADQTLQLDLKKVELKDFARTDLIKYDNQTEVDETRLTAVPQDLTNYYLKLTSADQKTTYLAVKAIEETTVDGKAVYKVTAEADNLVQRDAQNHFAQTYSYYIEKPKASQANVYYDFAELVNAIQANPSGEFRLGQSMSARHVVPNGKSYITTEFTGKLLSDGDKRFAIYDLEHPLFNVINGGTIKNINFENVDINRPDQNQIATLGFNLKNKGLIEDVKVTGSVTGNNDVAGIVNKIDEDGKIENVAFVGKINSVGNNSTVGGIAGSNYMGFVNRAYVDATITAQNANASMLVPFVTYMLNSWKSGTKAKVTNSVAKGVLDVKNTRNVGGIVAKTWPYGAVQDNVTYAKVIKGQEIFASNDVNDEDGGPHIKDLFGVVGYSSAEDGTGKDTKSPKKLKHLTKEEADKRVGGYKITADTFVSEPYALNTLNNVSSQAEFANIQDYNPEYKQAYKNIEKFQPFYNKDYIVYQANKLAKDHNLNTKEVLSVTPMNDSNFVTDLSTASSFQRVQKG